MIGHKLIDLFQFDDSSQIVQKKKQFGKHRCNKRYRAKMGVLGDIASSQESYNIVDTRGYLNFQMNSQSFLGKLYLAAQLIL